MESTELWWGYLNIRGDRKLKKYTSNIEVVEASESPYVLHTVEPFEASNRREAAKILRAKTKAS